jgi:hypothetical protein
MYMYMYVTMQHLSFTMLWLVEILQDLSGRQRKQETKGLWAKAEVTLLLNFVGEFHSASQPLVA